MMASQFVIESIVRAVMKEMVRESQKGSLSQTKTLYIPTGVSNRHVHLSQEHANILFGKGKVFKNPIRINAEIEKAQDHQMPINYYNRECNGFIDYMNLADEVINYGR